MSYPTSLELGVTDSLLATATCVYNIFAYEVEPALQILLYAKRRRCRKLSSY